MMPIKPAPADARQDVADEEVDPSVTKRLLFVIPPTHTDIDSITKDLAQYKEIPYGVLSIATYAKARALCNVRIGILDMNSYGGPAEKLIVKTLAEFERTSSGFPACSRPCSFLPWTFRCWILTYTIPVAATITLFTMMTVAAGVCRSSAAGAVPSNAYFARPAPPPAPRRAI